MQGILKVRYITCCSMPATVRRTLFDPFMTAGKPNGTGLGLTLARRIAEEHGGSVCFEESNRERTAFTLSLTKNRSLSLEALKGGRAGFEASSNQSASLLLKKQQTEMGTP